MDKSLVRLDLMCLFNERTGHGRPVKRQLAQRGKAQSAVVVERKESKVALPEIEEPVSQLQGLSETQRKQVEELTMIGFEAELAARALKETGFNTENAANYLFSGATKLIELEKQANAKRAKAKTQREERKVLH